MFEDLDLKIGDPGNDLIKPPPTLVSCQWCTLVCHTLAYPCR